MRQARQGKVSPASLLRFRKAFSVSNPQPQRRRPAVNPDRRARRARMMRAIARHGDGFGFRFGRGRTGVLAYTQPDSTAPINSINADGWSGKYNDVPAGPYLNESFPLTRYGYNSSAAEVTFEETIDIQYRRRQPYPNQASLDDDDVTFGTWIVGADGTTGVDNQSLLISPAPICAWTMPHRLTLNTTINLSMTVWHWAARGGKQVACVKFIISDGVTTLSQIVSSTSKVLQQSGLYVEEYALTGFDISSLNNGLITVNGEAYPFVGLDADGSVAKSATGAGSTFQRDFSPRYFRKDTVRAANPPTAYVDPAGNDTTGTWGTVGSPGLPFATPQGANNATNVSGRGLVSAGFADNNVDGAQVLINAGTYAVASATTTRAQAISGIKWKRNPATTSAASDVVLNISSYRGRLGVTGMTVPTNNGCVILEEVKLVRTAAGTFSGETGSILEVILVNVVLDNNSQTASMLSGTSTTPSCAYHFGTTFQNLVGGGSLTAAAGTSSTQGDNRLYKGCTGTGAHTIAVAGALEPWLMLGCSWSRLNCDFGVRTGDGSIVAFNKFMDLRRECWGVGGTEDINRGAVFASNVLENTHTTSSSPTMGVSRDSATGDTKQVILVNNTTIGAAELGRSNLFYCDKGATGTIRFHTFFCVKGNILSAIYVKGDWFVGTNNNGTPDPVNAPNYIGHMPFEYGVNVAGNMQQWQTVANGVGTSEGPAWIGDGSIRPAPGVLTWYNPLFVDYKGTTYVSPTFTAGLGFGDYRLQASSPAKSINPDAVLSFTLDGANRTAANDNAGALSAAA